MIVDIPSFQVSEENVDNQVGVGGQIMKRPVQHQPSTMLNNSLDVQRKGFRELFLIRHPWHDSVALRHTVQNNRHVRCWVLCGFNSSAQATKGQE
jgi:hypothetical protein